MDYLYSVVGWGLLVSCVAATIVTRQDFTRQIILGLILVCTSESEDLLFPESRQDLWQKIWKGE